MSCHLKGIHTYDLLRNPSYHQAFSYYSADNNNRELMIVDGDSDEDNDVGQSDLVRVALNLAFLSQEEVKEIEFSTEGMNKLREKIEKK